MSYLCENAGSRSGLRYFDGSTYGLGANDIDAFDISIEQGAAQASPTLLLLENPVSVFG
jgi:hypothetical protein